MKHSRQLFAVALMSPTLLMWGCWPWGSKSVNVSATCIDNNGVTSADFGPSRVGNTSVGILNTHHFGPGDVIELIPPSGGGTLGTGSRVDTLKYSDGDFLSDDPPADASQVIATDWNISADANVPSTVTVQVKTDLQNNTQLKITGGSRHAFAHPLDLLSADSDLTTRILGHPDRTYIVVTGIVNATSVSLQYAKQDSGSANVSVVKIGQFDVTISYSCSNVTQIAASGQTKAGVAFFYTTVGAVNGKVDTVSTADLSKYSLSNAFE